MHGVPAGFLEELKKNYLYRFCYYAEYEGAPISLAMPVRPEAYMFKTFPPFFYELLPEGVMLDGLLRQYKIDKNDLFRQLVVVGRDTVGAVTIFAA